QAGVEAAARLPVRAEVRRAASGRCGMSIPKTSRPGQTLSDTHGLGAGSAQTSPPATLRATPIPHSRAGFDLSSVVRQVLRTSPSADLDVIAKDVYERIPEEHREAALR